MSCAALQAALGDFERLFVITGAGVSAPSGIDTYRDHSGAWQRSMPIQHQEFLNRHDVRQRYWARSLRGWPAFRDAQPNPAHAALVELERMDRAVQARSRWRATAAAIDGVRPLPSALGACGCKHAGVACVWRVA